MRALNGLMWQIAFILLLVYAGWTSAALVVTGFCIGFWFCVVQIATILSEEVK